MLLRCESLEPMSQSGSFRSFPPSRRVRFAPKSGHSAKARLYAGSRADLGRRWPSQQVATASEGHVVIVSIAQFAIRYSSNSMPANSIEIKKRQCEPKTFEGSTRTPNAWRAYGFCVLGKFPILGVDNSTGMRLPSCTR
jgi:hypothetical protein